MRRRPAVPVVAVLALCALSGCEPETVPCPSWAEFPTLEEKYDAADLVVVASSSTRDGTAPVFGVDAHAYEVLKGDVAGDRVRIASMPDPCSGTAAYPGGDPWKPRTPFSCSPPGRTASGSR